MIVRQFRRAIRKSNQAKLLCAHLKKKGHEIHFLANAYLGCDTDYVKLSDGTIFDYKIYGHATNNPYFSATMDYMMKTLKPDRFIILLDTFMLHPWFLNVDTSPAKTFFWFPSDGGGGLPVGCDQILRKIDQPVAMAKFGQKQVKDYHGLEVAHIPHGCEPERYYRLPDDQRTELRKKWNLHDKFVVGVVARNQPRKNLDRMLKTIKLLKDRIPNLILFLHMDPDDVAPQVFNMKSLIMKYGLENRVMFSGMKFYKGFDWGEMNNVYNLMDCFFLSTSGEGFGIPIIEAMACEVPVVATDYTTTPELVINNKAGLGINLAGVETVEMFETESKEYDLRVMNGTMTGSWEVERGMCSVTHGADQIEYIFKNPKEAKQMGLNGRKAVLEKYDFKLVGKQWEEILA